MKPCLAVAALSLIAANASLAAPPPPTKADPVTDEYHGVSIVDEYRWLEGDDKAMVTPEVAAWTDSQNAYTRDVLDSLPNRDKIEARLRELMTVGSVGAPSMRRGFYFNRERKGDEQQAILYVREGHDGEPRVLIDPNALDEKGLLSLDWTAPNHDGTLLAFGVSRAGDENYTLHVLDVRTGEWLADEIPNKVTGVNWLPDSSGFFYSRLRDPADAYSRQIMFHRLGTHPRHDEVLFEQHSTTWGPFFGASEDARWGILGYFQSTRSNDLWVIDLDRYFRTGEFERVEIAVGEDHSFSGDILGDTLYMQTDMGAPNGRVFAVNLNQPSRDNWEEVIPERDDAVLRGFGIARGMLVASYLKDARTEIRKFALDGAPMGEVELPGIGSASLSTNRDRTEAFLTFTSYNEPTSIYRVDLASGERSLWARPDVPVDPSILEVNQVWYTSKDGTRIPMFVVHRKGLKLTGDHPTVLYGYGGFNIPMTPSFSATNFVWLENGGVYAVANLRGGGEYGDEWHQAGMLENKQNVFDDFIAAAEHLIGAGYTNPQKLAIFGGSNGGLLTGAAVVQRPDLFRAAISAVPLLDMLRYQQFLMARFWVPEYGTAENPEHFAFLRAYSPYQNIEEGVAYPAVFFTAGENDTRVHALHARKMAAAMQAATSSDPSEKPILLWVDREAGHGAGKPLDLQVRDAADRYAFLMWQLGVLDNL